MALFTILGRPDCLFFAHAIIIADGLSENLPDFHVKTIQKIDDNLKDYVERINTENGWNCLETPIIWKVIGAATGKKYLIGGLCDFLEYCSCYYGIVDCSVPKSELYVKVKNNLQKFKENQLKPQFNKTVSLIGFENKMIELIIDELPTSLKIHPHEICVRIFDPSFNISMCTQKVLVTNSYKELITDADILIILEDLSQSPNDSLTKWLTYCCVQMKLLAEEVNYFASRDLKIILNHPGCTCFTASVLAAFCKNVLPSNIVAITADEGLTALNNLSRFSGIAVERMGAPPVWGWPKFVDFVDLNSIVVRAECIRPFKRATKLPIEQTLPQGELTMELRFGKYVVNKLIEKKITQKRMESRSNLGKVRSVISLLKLWYGDGGDSVISLGIYSHGCFGLPRGVVISQPVSLNSEKVWQPYIEYPINRDIARKIRSFFYPIRQILCMLAIPNLLCYCPNCIGRSFIK